ncbi:hypothetical protein [Nocardia cyriacigeorgica]|uniref:hypothetical protein n=1 Tax=Nocardia cyriacigeorgica TaxID=135487 RepID=UPI00245614B0|nr:hypothetical protein [Nocardia cyriacigeorgica]
MIEVVVDADFGEVAAEFGSGWEVGGRLAQVVEVLSLRGVEVEAVDQVGEDTGAGDGPFPDDLVEVGDADPGFVGGGFAGEMMLVS